MTLEKTAALPLSDYNRTTRMRGESVSPADRILQTLPRLEFEFLCHVTV